MLCKLSTSPWARTDAFRVCKAPPVARAAKGAGLSSRAEQEPLLLAGKRATLSKLIGISSVSALMLQRLAGTAAASSSVEQVLQNPNWPGQWPFRAENFQRYDESSDGFFYDNPRFVYHIDDSAVKALTQCENGRQLYYSRVFPTIGDPNNLAVLDLCSSWISHYPKKLSARRVAGLGMNALEMGRNSVLTEWTVKNLNEDPKLPYDDKSFDIVTNAVSVDYLTRPLDVFREMHRVLKPGGRAILSFSNRCFPTKAISIWTSTGDADHVWIVGSYFHYSVPGGFSEPQCEDISPKATFWGSTDPMYVVSASRKA